MSWRTITDRAERSEALLRLADVLGRGRGRFRWLDSLHRPPPAPHRPDLRDWSSQTLAAAWIGHATVLLRVGDLTILTDPVLGNRVGLGLGLLTAGPARLVAPALKLQELPPIDVILVSHAHFDHLDRPTLQRLGRDAHVILSHDTGDLIDDLGFSAVTELRWGESITLRGVKFSARPVQHWGARTFLDRHRGFGAFLIESPRHRVLYGGDTAFFHGFDDIGRVDLAILGIGGYDPFIQAHATPEQALAMADQLRADHILPMHHSTFRLSHEPVQEPLQRLLAAAGSALDRIVIRAVGGQWTLGGL